jgi:flavin reductase (DIM6/NTAB) family NADH-FMN oxidoreductase RutF
MKPSEAFGVVVRGMGLVTALSALGTLLAAMASPFALLGAIPPIVVGLWLLRNAPTVVAFAYPEEDRVGHSEAASDPDRRWPE